jgi:hypothetical protein
MEATHLRVLNTAILKFVSGYEPLFPTFHEDSMPCHCSPRKMCVGIELSPPQVVPKGEEITTI